MILTEWKSDTHIEARPRKVTHSKGHGSIFSGKSFLADLHLLAGPSTYLPTRHTAAPEPQTDPPRIPSPKLPNSVSSVTLDPPGSFPMVTQHLTSDNTDSGSHAQDIILSGLNVRTLALPRHFTTVTKNTRHDEIGHTPLEEDGEIAKLPILLKEFSLDKIDCIAMSETRVRLLPTGDHPMFLDREGYNIYFSGVAGTRRLAGVGIAISQKWLVQSVFPINARVMYITAFTPYTPVTIFSV